MMTVNDVSKLTGVSKMDLKVFDTTKMDEYTRKAKEQWGQTAEYKEYKEKSKKQSSENSKTSLAKPYAYIRGIWKNDG